jgi:hypothetical protein
MFKSMWLAIPAASVLCCVTVWVANAQAPAPAQGPSFAVYCRGPLSTFRTEGARSGHRSSGRKKLLPRANPGAGECAWADGPPQGLRASR